MRFPLMGVESVQFFQLGDAAVIIQFKEEISDDTRMFIRNICNFLDEYSFEGLIEYVPAFTSVTLFYDPLLIDHKQLRLDLEEMLEEVLESKDATDTRIVEIPVLYGNAWGPDLEFVAGHSGISTAEVIDLHTKPLYVVHMIGFAPGFPYLGGMDERIAVPRKETPRASIVAGSVGIAGKQTGVYPIATPGGWQIIGRTPLDLFNFNHASPALLKAGDNVRFVSISEAEFDRIRRAGLGN